VIDGFRIDMTADEIIRHIEKRIEHHRQAAAECETKRMKMDAVEPPLEEDDEDGAVFACWPGYTGALERRAERHKEAEAALVFLRDHIVSREVYRLGEHDLRLLELWPRRARTALGI
jgi:hypothetical protein